jgi:SAM-dependent methyltransferase
MAEENVGRKQLVSFMVKYGVLPASSLIIGYMIVQRIPFKTLQRRLFAFIWRNFSSQRFRDILNPVKQDLFSPLKFIESKDPVLSSKGVGCLRILEIGVGDGANFKFYPNGVHLISVEPNPYFEKHFKENSNSFPDIVIEEFIRGGAEDMSDVPSASVDVVVSTHVLCSITNIAKAMQEIKRVLVTGGKFFYLEHVAYQNCRSSSILQVVVEPFWKIFSDGCRLTQNLDEIVSMSGMKSEKRDFVIVEGLYHVMKPHVVGVLVKVSPDD